MRYGLAEYTRQQKVGSTLRLLPIGRPCYYTDLGHCHNGWWKHLYAGLRDRLGLLATRYLKTALIKIRGAFGLCSKSNALADLLGWLDDGDQRTAEALDAHFHLVAFVDCCNTGWCARQYYITGGQFKIF